MILLKSVVNFNVVEYTLVCAQQYGDDQVPMYGTLNLHINGFINYWTCSEQLLFYRQDLFTKRLPKQVRKVWIHLGIHFGTDKAHGTSACSH